MSKLRKSAKGEQCTLQIPGVCNFDTATTVLAHLPDDSGTGKMGGKSEDWCACFACSDCHALIDNQAEFQKRYTSEDYLFFIRRAMIKTWRKWFNAGLLEVR
jgi:hypothetical protein